MSLGWTSAGAVAHREAQFWLIIWLVQRRCSSLVTESGELMSSFLGKSPSSADDSTASAHQEWSRPAHQQASQTWILPQHPTWWGHNHPVPVISKHNCRPSALLREKQGLPFPPGFGPQDLVHKYYEYLTLYDGCGSWKCLFCHHCWGLVLTSCKDNGNRIVLTINMLLVCAIESFCLASYT